MRKLLVSSISSRFSGDHESSIIRRFYLYGNFDGYGKCIVYGTRDLLTTLFNCITLPVARPHNFGGTRRESRSVRQHGEELMLI